MAKRKADNNKATAARGEAPVPAPAAAASSKRWWPEEFLAPAPSAIIVGAGLLASAFIVFLVSNNALVGFKQMLGYLVGLSNPLDVGVPPTSRDAGTVILGFIWIMIGGAIHPAVGLALLALLRPWLDGYTFQTDNMYFVWGVVYCFVLWGVRTVMRGGEVRAWKPALLLAFFPFVAFVFLPYSINYNESYRALILWAAWVVLFFLTANLSANPRIFRFLVGAIIVSITAEAVFAAMQYKYILPFLRAMIQQDPALLKDTFGVENAGAELTRRFNINRAFGTVLFPNAFGAFLILWIPLIAASAWNNLMSWRVQSAAARDVTPPQTSAHRLAAAGLAATAWFVGTILLFGLMQFPMTYVMGAEHPWYFGPVAAPMFAAAVALLPATGLFILAASRNVGFALTVARTALYGLALFIALYALAITFSRGPMLGLFLGGGLGLSLLLLPAHRVLNFVPRFLKRAATVSAACLMAAVFLAQAPAPAVPPAVAPVAAQANSPALSPAPPIPSNPTPQLSAVQKKPGSAITTEGQNVGVRDLVSGESFRARLTYWRVGLSMFLDNPWTGVGLRCFGWAYPKYQYLGAMDVRESHNALIQALCETGIFGGLAFILFWVWTVVVGIVRAVEEQDPARRVLYAGMTAGLAAFLLHSLVDINFSHPGLMFFAAILAGFIFGITPVPPQSTRWTPSVVLPALLLSTLCAGMGLRVYQQDLALSRITMIGVAEDREMEMRSAVGKHFLLSLWENTLAKKRLPMIYFASAQTLFPDPEQLMKMGNLYQRTGEGKLAPLRMGDKVPPDTLLLVNKPWPVTKAAIVEARRVLAELEGIDARFPHNAKLASYISGWYTMLAEAAFVRKKPDDLNYFNERMIYWAQQAVARTPWDASAHNSLGGAYWDKARFTSNTDNRDDYTKAFEAIERATQFAAVTPAYWSDLTRAGVMLADAYDRAGMKEAAQKYRDKATAAGNHGGELHTMRIRLGVDPTPTTPEAPNPAPGAGAPR